MISQVNFRHLSSQKRETEKDAINKTKAIFGRRRLDLKNAKH